MIDPPVSCASLMRYRPLFGRQAGGSPRISTVSFVRAFRGGVGAELNPQARRQLWDLADGLKQAGRTIILTTDYMDEAERLCERIAIMDHGRVITL